MPKNGRATRHRWPKALRRVRPVERTGLGIPVFVGGSLRSPGQEDSTDNHSGEARHPRHAGGAARQRLVEQEQPAHYGDHVVDQNGEACGLEHPAPLEGQLEGDEPESRTGGENGGEEETVSTHGAFGRQIPYSEEETCRAPQRHGGACGPGHEAGEQPRRADACGDDDEQGRGVRGRGSVYTGRQRHPQEHEAGDGDPCPDALASPERRPQPVGQEGQHSHAARPATACTRERGARLSAAM